MQLLVQGSRADFEASFSHRVSKTVPAVANPNTTMAAPTSANNVQAGAPADDSHQPPMATIASLALDASTGPPTLAAPCDEK
jgi:hypothetical protein